MSRGIERRVIFLDDSFRLHFLELLGDMSERFGVEVHAYVLMGNHSGPWQGCQQGRIHGAGQAGQRQSSRAVACVT